MSSGVFFQRASLYPSAQIIPSENDIFVSFHTLRHEYHIHTDLFPNKNTPCRMKRLFISNSRPPLAFITRFDVGNNVLIHSIPMITTRNLSVRRLASSVS